jgi:hypothetical protein
VTFSRDQKYADDAVELSIDLNHLGSPEKRLKHVSERMKSAGQPKDFCGMKVAD